MAMDGVTKCAVPHCIAPIFEFNNLCDDHLVPGAVIRVGKSTMVITCWFAQHADECGVILINDFALGDLFGGQVGFEMKLAEQGFFNVRLLRTPAELEAAKLPKSGKKVGEWSGPWLTRYPWENGADEEDDNPEGLEWGI
jgi:hypothetical protein